MREVVKTTFTGSTLPDPGDSLMFCSPDVNAVWSIRRTRRVAVTLVSVVLGSACADTTSVPSVVVRDSAGIAIVENSEVPGSAEGWFVDERPTLRIGSVDGSAGYQFSDVVAAWRLADGSIVVADRPSAQIRYFDPTGRFRNVVGGVGGGPGEFQSLTGATAYRGDSIAAWDGVARRISIFDGRGTLGRDQAISLARTDIQRVGEHAFGFFPLLAGAFADGSIVLTAPTRVHFNVGERFSYEKTLVRFSAEGDSLNMLGRFHDAEGMSHPDADIEIAFPRRSTAVVTDDQLVIGENMAYEFKVKNVHGTLDRLFRSSHRHARAVDDSARAAYRNSERQRRRLYPASPESIERALPSVQFPSHVPFYSDVQVDSENRLWVQDYELPGATGPIRWSIFDDQGQLLSTATFPSKLVVHQIGSEFVLGVEEDDLDVPFVVIYPLVRGQRPNQ